jgi:hypothetical protein
MLGRRLPLTGLLLLPMACYVMLSAQRALSPRPEAEPSLKPRPRWTPGPTESRSPSPSVSGPARPRPVSPLPTGSWGSAAAPTATPQATASAAATGSIPNVDADEILSALTRAGLECSSVSYDTARLTWTCSAETGHATYLVVVHGARTDAITRLRATVTRADTDFLAARFLSSLAGLAYTGAEPARAADWVNRNLAANGSITIGPVRFALSGAPGARSLDVVAEGLRP